MFSPDDQISFSDNYVYHVSAGGFVFCRKNDQLFVALIKDQDNKLVIPKGHLKQSEEPLTAAVREVQEELGIIDELKSLGFIEKITYEFSMPDDNRKHVKELFIYAFEVSSLIDLHPLVVEGISEAAWFTINEAQQTLSFYQKSLEKGLKLFY